MGNKIADILGSLFVVALVTALTLPGRQTPAVIKEASSGLAGLTYASLGLPVGGK